jgi:hypothetical protein
MKKQNTDLQTLKDRANQLSLLALDKVRKAQEKT